MNNLHSFSSWLQAEIAELNSQDAPDVCEGAAAIVREARRIAQSLSYPDLVPRCTVDMLAVSTARDILSRTLATIDPPNAGPLTVKQAADRLAVSEKTIYKMIKKGRLRCQRIGRAIRINTMDLDGLNDGLNTETPQRYRHLQL
jgi:excisionase family DNA binding protein